MLFPDFQTFFFLFNLFIFTAGCMLPLAASIATPCQFLPAKIYGIGFRIFFRGSYHKSKLLFWTLAKLFPLYPVQTIILWKKKLWLINYFSVGGGEKAWFGFLDSERTVAVKIMKDGSTFREELSFFTANIQTFWVNFLLSCSYFRAFAKLLKNARGSNLKLIISEIQFRVELLITPSKIWDMSLHTYFIHSFTKSTFHFSLLSPKFHMHFLTRTFCCDSSHYFTRYWSVRDR